MKNSVRHLSVVMFGILISFSCFAQEDARPGATKNQKPASPVEKIKQFWFVMIKTGPKDAFDSVARAKLFEGHMANMKRLYNDGILKVAGPFGKNEFTWQGIFILDCETKEEAEKIVGTDPAVAAGLFAVDIIQWYSEPCGSFKKGKPDKAND